MDRVWTMLEHSLPSLASLSQRLAKNNRRLGRAIDQLPTLVQQLLAAFHRRDQRSLRELSQKLISSAAGQPTLAAVAGELDGQIQSRQRRPVQRTLLALVGQLGGLRRRGIIPAAVLPPATAH